MPEEVQKLLTAIGAIAEMEVQYFNTVHKLTDDLELSLQLTKIFTEALMREAMGK